MQKAACAERLEVSFLKIFDFDGTLIDSNGIWVQVDLDFLTLRGKIPTQEYTEFVAHAIFPTAAQFTKDYYALSESPAEIMSSWLELARDAYANHAPVKEGVFPYLEQCREQGESFVLFTASVPELCYLALKRHGLDSYFQQVVFAQELELEKRNPEAFTALCTQLDIDPSQCIMFDDAPKNCSAARAAGLRVVGVYDDFFADVEAEVRANSDRYIRSFSELLSPSCNKLI